MPLSGVHRVLLGHGHNLNMSANEELVRFRVWGQPGILGAFLSAILLMALAGCISAFTHPHRHDVRAEQVALVAVLLCLSLLLSRVFRSGTLITTTAGVECRSILRTYRWQWKDLSHFEEVTGVIGASGSARRYVRAHLTSGGHVNLTELNTSTRRDPDKIADLVQKLNAMHPVASQ